MLFWPKKFNSLVFTFLIIILLGGAVGVLWRQRTASFAKPLPWEQLTKITLAEEEKKIVLKKDSGQWWVENEKNLPADKNKIENLIDSLKALERRELVSQNKEKHSLFEVDKEKPSVVLEFVDHPSVSLIVGKNSYSRGGTFIRFPQKDETFLVPSYLDAHLASENWKNLRVLESVSLETEKVSLAFPSQKKSATVEKEKADKLLAELDYLRGQEVYLKEDKKEQIQQPDFTITLLQQKDKEIQINFFATQTEFLVSQEKEMFVFSLEEEKYQTIRKEAEQLLSS